MPANGPKGRGVKPGPEPWRWRRVIGIFRSLIWSKTLIELIFNPCGEFRWSPEGPVNQIHSPHHHVCAHGIFSDLSRSVQMLKREVGAESNGKLLHLFTYVTVHSLTLPSLYLRHSSFSNSSVASPTSQLILQPLFRFSYVTGSSLTSPGEPPMQLLYFRDVIIQNNI